MDGQEGNSLHTYTQEFHDIWNILRDKIYTLKHVSYKSAEKEDLVLGRAITNSQSSSEVSLKWQLCNSEAFKEFLQLNFL